MSNFTIKITNSSGYTHIRSAEYVDIERYQGSPPNIRVFERADTLENLTLDYPCRAYIMNALGKTVDSIEVGEPYEAPVNPDMQQEMAK